jgi:FKBP-type peptidyl-prolyl cis-trans isomerase FkpA
MPPSKKSTKASPGDSTRRARVNHKPGQQQTARSIAQVGGEEESSELQPAGARGRKATSPSTGGRERKAAPERPAAYERKLTPQQQMHLKRARRRRRNQRLIFGTIALVLILVVALVIQQIVAKNEAITQLANAHAASTATSGAATATAGAKATATESVLAPDSPPAVLGKTVTLPDGLQYIDIKVGTGQEAQKGDTVSVQYTGWLQSDDVKFDSSYDSNGGQPFQVTLGAGQVIPGWDEGIVGMKAGGTRRLIIPPALAYGAQGYPPKIPANATLIFDIQLVSIDNTSTSTPTPSS